MATRRCCCNCVVLEDNMNRADVNPPSGSWTVVNGSWEIKDNTLNCVTDGVVVTSARQSAPSVGTAYTTWNLVTLDSNGGAITEWHLIQNFVDANNFDWIKVYADSGYYWPAFYHRVGGADTLVMDKTTHPQVSGWSLESGKLQVKVCVSTVEWSIAPAGAQGEIVWQTCDITPVTSLPSDASHGLLGFKKGRVDDFQYQIHWESRRSCPSCNCFCYVSASDYACIEEVLRATFIPVGGPYSTCATPAEWSVLLYQQNPTTAAAPTPPVFGSSRKTPRKFVWYSELFPGDNGSGPPIHGAFPWLILVCDTAFNRAYSYVTEYPDSNLVTPTITGGLMPNWASPEITIPNGRSKYYDLAESTCIPLSMVFKGLVFPRSAMGQCDVRGTEYDVIITPP